MSTLVKSNDIDHMICPECHVALMYQHRHLHDWEQCEFCGFTQKIEEQLTPAQAVGRTMLTIE